MQARRLFSTFGCLATKSGSYRRFMSLNTKDIGIIGDDVGWKGFNVGNGVDRFPRTCDHVIGHDVAIRAVCLSLRANTQSLPEHVGASLRRRGSDWEAMPIRRAPQIYWFETRANLVGGNISKIGVRN